MGYTADDMIEAANVMGRLEKMSSNTGSNSKYFRHEEICKELNDLYVSKNKEYGDSFGKAYEDIGQVSAVTQLYHKMQRIVSISKKDERDITYESLEDNLMDLSNYAIMYLIELQDK